MIVCGTVHSINTKEEERWELRTDNGEIYLIRDDRNLFKEGLRIECVIGYIDHIDHRSGEKRKVAVVDSRRIVIK